MNKYYLVGHDSYVDRLFKKKGYEPAESEEDCDFAIFTGGADIYPYLYGERPMKSTFHNLRRDMEEIKIFKNLPVGMPKIGICRGGQLFNIMCGGSMWQNVDRHIGVKNHDIKDFATGEIIRVNSVHHQMMIPSENAFIIAAARESRKKEKEGLYVQYTDKGREQWDDIEVVYYKNFNCLCYQAHPEHDEKPAQDYFFYLVDTYLGGQNGGKPIAPAKALGQEALGQIKEAS